MDFQLTAEQAELSGSVRRLLDKHYEFEARKQIITSEAGHSAAAWSQLAEMGVIGLAVPEQRGGYASGADVATSLAPIMQQVGETLCLEPVLGNLVAAWLLSQCQPDAASDELLERLIAGDARVALALDASQTHALRCKQHDAAYVLNGPCALVHAASQSDHVLFYINTDTGKLLITSIKQASSKLSHESIYRTVDNQRASDLLLNGFEAASLQPIKGDVNSLLDAANDLSCLLACAEAVGAMRYACDATLDYLKTRKQFGQPIGAFQALQHRMVDMTIEQELARAMVDLACAKFDAAMRGELTVTERQHMVSAAKIKVSDAARKVGQEAIQLHGGMGMANEMKVSHAFKRLTVIAQTFGDVDQHLARFAATDQ